MVKISALDGCRVALWGWGREGRAAYRALRRCLPDLALTLFCSAAEVTEAAALDDDRLEIETAASGEKLASFDVVIKSPGISPYGEAVRHAAERGTRFIGGTALWFGERGAMERTLCVTGTKGKSTTTALLAHLLRAAGRRTALAGNIGLPLLELLDAEADEWAIELSSYQTRDVAAGGERPTLAIITNIFPEHLDWHGSQQQYVADKLALVTAAHPHIAVLNADDATLRGMFGGPHTVAADDEPHTVTRAKAGAHAEDARQSPIDSSLRWNGGGASVPSHGTDADPQQASRLIWFNTPQGWHLRDGVIHRGDVPVLDTANLPLPGTHNRSNLCGVLAALEAIGMDAAALASHAHGFQPLPNRVQRLGVRDGIEVVNDSISTTPYAALAALEVFAGQRIALLIGGHDRGLDWQDFADAMRTSAPHCIVTMGANGPRIHAMLAPIAEQAGFVLRAADDLADAVAKARAELGGSGVLLLSPGAPSFGAYTDYVARGRHFAELNGFDPDAISAIEGLGIDPVQNRA
ncbi:MAG: Mur ligase family protein [Pseudomonadota bacterium]|nr:Mur ligase family protein [Pseudomonadota bacterium]